MIVYLMDGLSILGMVLFFRIPFIVASLYASDQWVTREPIREPKPWENISLS